MEAAIGGHASEVKAGSRFEFGKNWQRFLSVLNEDRIKAAENGLATMLGTRDLTSLSFLDIGSGSGLSSLAARRLGAKVVSFDFDPYSVACTRELRRRYFSDDPKWEVFEGSILDEDFINSLGKHDIVYSWGVLHHTGQMWPAVQHSMIPVKEKGQYFVALYNDQELQSKIWLKVKQIYCSSFLGKWLMIGLCFPYFAATGFAVDILKRRNPVLRYISYGENRGMSIIHDWYDWLGGLPFEVAKPEQVLEICGSKGFTIEKMTTTNRLGCNQFVFRRHKS